MENESLREKLKKIDEANKVGEPTNDDPDDDEIQSNLDISQLKEFISPAKIKTSENKFNNLNNKISRL